MENAKDELLKILENKPKMLCAKITLGDSYDKEDIKTFKLETNHTENELELFLSSLDFDYDSGFGGQNLFGLVWLTDGTWLERGEYDGSEWWEHKACPDVPQDLTPKELA